jgi:hypothetical protein
VAEKEQENSRRRAARQQQKLRGEAEGARGERLRELKDAWAGVAQEDRRIVAGALRQSMLAGTVGGVEVPVEERLQSSFAQLDALHAAFRVDESNPVYSKNQILITEEERTLFSSILSHETLTGPPLLDHNEEVALTIAKSDALGLSHRRRSTGVPKSAFIDTMVGLFPSSTISTQQLTFASLTAPRTSSRRPLRPALGRPTARSRGTLHHALLARPHRLRRFGGYGRRRLWSTSSPSTQHISGQPESCRSRRRRKGNVAARGCSTGDAGGSPSSQQDANERAGPVQVDGGAQIDQGGVRRLCPALRDRLYRADSFVSRCVDPSSSLLNDSSSFKASARPKLSLSSGTVFSRLPHPRRRS